MARTLFIADLHLSQYEPAITAGFLRFLQREAIDADALYILGDLFESWIGDDDPQPLYTQVAAGLQTLKDHGVPCYFIHGNRDFLVGHRFACLSGMKLLPSENVIEIYGKRIVILHGDTLCSDDANYQRFRRIIHQRWLQKLFLLLPLFIRQHIAARMRTRSKNASREKSAALMDVSELAVAAALQRYQAPWMIHGHTHLPAVHPVRTDAISAERIVLGAWHQQGYMVQVDIDTITLCTFSF